MKFKKKNQLQRAYIFTHVLVNGLCILVYNLSGRL